MLGLIFSLYLAITLVVCFISIRYGVAMYLMYVLLVPYVSFFTLGENFFSLMLVIALVANFGFRNLKYEPLIPFIFLFVAQLCLIPLHDDVPLTLQLNFFRVDILSNLLVPFVVLNVLYFDRKALGIFLKILIFSILVAVGYSIYLTQMPGVNPYLMIIKPLSGGVFNEAYALANNQGRMFGRISGVFNHPMTNGLFLCLSVVFTILMLHKVSDIKKRIGLVILLLSTVATIFLIGVRSAIGAISIGLCIYLLLEKKFKLLLYSFLCFIVLLTILLTIPGIGDFVLSIFDADSSNVNGSSLTMRLNQFDGALNEIRFNELFGKGYNWSVYYLSKHETHPVLLAFESLIYVILCNNGFAGILLWVILIIFYYKRVTAQFNTTYSNILLTLFSTYLGYSIITGEYGYMKYLLIFYTVMWMSAKDLQSEFSTNK